MSTQIKTAHFKKALFTLLEEFFENVQGICLDRGTSMFETLATINAEEASRPVGGKCATLAAQVKHVAFYLEVVERNVRDGQFHKVDWGEIWRTVSAVSPDEWQSAQAELRHSYDRIKALIEGTDAWPDDIQVGVFIALVAHTAYHLGEIRQALCTLKP